MDANALLARWWRRTQSQYRSASENISPTRSVSTTDPRVFLAKLAKIPDAQTFLKQQAQRVRSQIQDNPSDDCLYALLSSLFEKLGDLEGAILQLEKAVLLDKQEECGAYQLNLTRLKREKEMILQRENFEKRLKMQKVEGKTKRKRADFESDEKSFKNRQVRRIDHSELSVERFVKEFEEKSIPVIITGLLEELTPKSWNFSHLQNHSIGSTKVELKRYNSESLNWARLEEATKMAGRSDKKSLKEFITSLQPTITEEVVEVRSDGNEEKKKEKKEKKEDLLYLHDWSLPLNGPKLLEEFLIPKYFAHDFLQAAPTGSLYRDSWPSLFIGPKGSKSDLHVDTFHSNFWMALFQGRKRWVFFPPEDLCLLYPSYGTNNFVDPIFEIDVSHLARPPPTPPTPPTVTPSQSDQGTPNLTSPLSAESPSPQSSPHSSTSENTALTKTTSYRYTHPFVCDLHPGEILFVPAGTPHYVENLDHTLAISGNFIDKSNFDGALAELKLNGLINERAKTLYRHLSDQKETLLKRKYNDENVPYNIFHAEQTDVDHDVQSDDLLLEQPLPKKMRLL